jgi:hypothetical protein
MMKIFKVFSILLIAILLMIGCSSDKESGDLASSDIISSGIDTPGNPVIPKDASGNYEIAINPNREYYDVVVMDIDRWEICMNYERVRFHCNSYTGHLWYQMGAFIFEGTSTALYNNFLDNLSVTALDSGWDRGHILYSMTFQLDTLANTLTNDLYGSFTYFEYPRRTNGIVAWLVRGQMGPHIFGLQPSSLGPEVLEQPVATEHPKKARLEALMD